jgi:hypothetical protein
LLLKVIDDALNEGLLGPDERQVDRFRLRKVGKAAEVSGLQADVGGFLGGAGVAGRGEKGRDLFALIEGVDEGMLAPPTSDNEDSHRVFDDCATMTGYTSDELRVEKLFGGCSVATPGSTRSLHSQRCDFVVLAQKAFCTRLSRKLSGYKARLSDFLRHRPLCLG